MLKSVDKLINLDLIIQKTGIGEGMIVADFGCGSSGHFVFPLAKAVGKNGQVIAIDILKKSLDNIKRLVTSGNYHNVETVWTNVEIFNGSKLEAGSVDSVLIINTLYQSKHRSSVIREAARILRKNGTINIIDWRKISSPLGPRTEDRVDPKHLIQIGQKLGLSLEEEFFVGKYHYGLIFQKL